MGGKRSEKYLCGLLMKSGFATDDKSCSSVISNAFHNNHFTMLINHNVCSQYAIS